MIQCHTSIKYCWGQKAPKRGMWILWTAHIKQKKQCNFGSGWFERQQTGVYCKRLVRHLNKDEGKYIQEQQPN